MLARPDANRPTAVVDGDGLPGDVDCNVWITDFQKHPYRVEWLRYEPDSPVTGPVRQGPHVAYRVESIAEASQGMKCLLEPFDAGIAVVGFYQSEDGAVIEFMEYPEDK